MWIYNFISVYQKLYAPQNKGGPDLQNFIDRASCPVGLLSHMYFDGIILRI